jgi:peptidase E
MTIVPFGGMRPTPGRTHPIVDYLLELANKERPKVALLAQATGDRPDYQLAFYNRFPAARCERSHVDLFFRSIADLRAHLLAQDIIFVGGGNTANLLAIWRVHGVDRILREAWEQGVVLTGGSAGSLCWFECGTTDSFNLYELAPLRDGLGFLPGSHCPHYDGEEQRRPLYHRLVAEGFPPGYAIDDDAACRFEGTELRDVVSARAGATAYRVEKRGNEVVETALDARALGEAR